MLTTVKLLMQLVVIEVHKDKHQGCLLYQFSRKLPEFEAHFTRLRIFKETPEFCKHSTFLQQNGTERTKSRCAICVVSVVSHIFKKRYIAKPCRVPTLIGVGTVDYSHIDHTHPTA